MRIAGARLIVITIAFCCEHDVDDALTITS